VRSEVRSLIAATGIFSIGYSMLLFTIPLFAVSVGSSASELGFIALVYTLPSFLVPMFVGRFLNRRKAMRVIQVSMLAYALPTLLFPYGSDFLEVAAIRTLQGFLGIAFWVSIEKELADLASHAETGRIMGFYNVSWSSAFLLGPFLGGYIIQTFDFKATFWATFLFLIIGLTPALLLRSHGITEGAKSSSERDENRTRSREPWQPRSLLAACLTVAAGGGVLGTMFSLFPAYVVSLGFSPVWAGLFIVIFSASRVATFLGLGMVIDKFGERRFMLAGLALSSSMIILGISGSAELLVLGLLILGVGSGMTNTSALTLASRSPSEIRGSSIGKFEVSFNLGIALMAQAGGISADVFSPSTPYILAGAVSLVSFFALFILVANRNR
jgi:MFS family permease